MRRRRLTCSGQRASTVANRTVHAGVARIAIDATPDLWGHRTAQLAPIHRLVDEVAAAGALFSALGHEGRGSEVTAT